MGHGDFWFVGLLLLALIVVLSDVTYRSLALDLAQISHLNNWKDWVTPSGIGMSGHWEGYLVAGMAWWWRSWVQVTKRPLAAPSQAPALTVRLAVRRIYPSEHYGTKPAGRPTTGGPRKRA
jgi:hypothetical protein